MRGQQEVSGQYHMQSRFARTLSVREQRERLGSGLYHMCRAGLLAHSAQESSMRGQGQSKELLVREVTRTLSARERRKRLGHIICAEQDLLAHSAQESSARGWGQSKKLLVQEVTRTLSEREQREWLGLVSIICAEQDLLAHSARERSEQEIARARGHSHTQPDHSDLHFR